VDAGTVWGAPESESVSFNEELKGATVTSKKDSQTWAALHFNEEFTTAGDGYVEAILYQNTSNAAFSSGASYQLSNYQFGIHADTDKRVNFRYAQVTIDGQEYMLAYSAVENMPADLKVTGIRAQLSSNQSYTFIAAAVLKNDADMDMLFEDILTQPEHTEPEPTTEPPTEPTEPPTEPATNPETSDSGYSIAMLFVAVSFILLILVKRRQNDTRSEKA
ncbi:MAG TPA: LPXTG cell wall anchor domain-containing protein, partial [Clostridia bacterium]|nr:LPXTG cell wall anchor domain-containing protein [Clostridia bacterium]